MAFDWLRFFDQHHIEYVTSGANVSGDNVAIHCPWCGVDDPSHHLSVSTTGKGYKCWRHKDHRGKNPIRLIIALLGCSAEAARRIVGSDVHIPRDFLTAVRTSLTAAERRPADVGVPPLPEFRDFRQKTRLIAPYAAYLEKRGFQHWRKFTRKYQMYWCSRGPFSGRIIFCVYHGGVLQTWTGRAISPSTGLRYKALSPDPNKARKEGLPIAPSPINHWLLWYDHLRKTGAHTLVLCEGPFDALKVRELGRKHGICATCFFLASPTPEQIALLHKLLPRFERRVILLDAGTTATSLRLIRDLRALGVEHGELPPGRKDPGELQTEDELLNILA